MPRMSRSGATASTCSSERQSCCRARRSSSSFARVLGMAGRSGRFASLYTCRLAFPGSL